MDLLSITKTSKWEVVKNSVSPKRPSFFSKRGGGTLSMPIHFPIGTRPHLAKKGGGMCLKCPPLDPPMNFVGRLVCSVNVLYMELSYTGSLGRSTRASEHVTVQISYACKTMAGFINCFPLINILFLMFIFN